MAVKNKMIEFEDSDFGSIHSSELSDLDSDVNSLSSLMSCAQSWIEDAEFKTPAENMLKQLSYAALVSPADSHTLHALDGQQQATMPQQ